MRQLALVQFVFRAGCVLLSISRVGGVTIGPSLANGEVDGAPLISWSIGTALRGWILALEAQKSARCADLRPAVHVLAW